MRGSLRRLLPLFALLAFVQPASACPVPTITLGIFEMPPFYGLDAAGKPAGELIDLMEQITALTGCQWTPLFHEDTPRLLENLVDGDADLGMLIRHPALEQKVVYGRIPVGALRLEAYHLPDRPDIKGIDELRGKRLIVIRGYGYGGLINKLFEPSAGIRLLPARDHGQAFDLLRDEKGDYLLDYHRPGTRTLNEKGLYHITSSTVQNKDIFFVASPRLAKPAELLETLERAVQQINRTSAAHTP